LRKTLHERGVTHILLFSWDDFANGYESLMADAAGTGHTSGLISKLIGGQTPPDWLRPLFYPVPAEFGLGEAKVWLFEVCGGQSPFDALLHRGVFAFEAGNFQAARELFTRAGEIQPGDTRISKLIGLCSEREAALPTPDPLKTSIKP